MGCPSLELTTGIDNAFMSSSLGREQSSVTEENQNKQSKLDRKTMRFFCWHSLGVPPGPKQKRGSSVDTTGSFLLIELDHVEVPNKI